MQLPNESNAEEQGRTVHILHLEDDEPYRELVRLLLEEAGIDCAITAVRTRAEFVRSLEERTWDLILSDHSLPNFDGMQALEIAAHNCLSTPFIFVTGTIGEDIAVESLKNGATDYILKNRMARLGGSVRRALNEREERQRREKAEADLKESEEQLRFLAYHDPLTGLPNRALFQDRLAHSLSSATRREERVALLFLDLDHFKFVNDSLGHSAGDIVLKEVGRRLERCARNNDTVARLGGDEFVVVLTAVRDITDAVMAADRIKREIAAELTVQGTLLSTTCSIGMSIFPDDGRDCETLLKHADIALFSAKDGGRNRWQFYTPEMNAPALERLTMDNALRQALAKEQFSLEYQPQLEFSTGRIIGAEALVRWRHPEAGLISPNRFISIAETSGEIIAIGEWVLRKACRQAKQWQDEGLSPIVVAVNVSAIQFRQESFFQFVQTVLKETGLDPRYLELEVSESVLLSYLDVMESLVHDLGKIGSHLAIDDFGTGYCSLSYLRRFQFSRLKIDQSFVKSIEFDARDAALTAAIINMANILGMKAIAECVETDGQVRALKSVGCDQIQGHYFCPPLSASSLSERVRSHYATLKV